MLYEHRHQPMHLQLQACVFTPYSLAYPCLSVALGVYRFCLPRWLLLESVFAVSLFHPMDLAAVIWSCSALTGPTNCLVISDIFASYENYQESKIHARRATFYRPSKTQGVGFKRHTRLLVCVAVSVD